MRALVRALVPGRFSRAARVIIVLAVGMFFLSGTFWNSGGRSQLTWRNPEPLKGTIRFGERQIAFPLPNYLAQANSYLVELATWASYRRMCAGVP